MKLFIGLGNLGKKYQNTRHNIGFWFLDVLAAHPEISKIGKSLRFKNQKKLESKITETIANGEKIILVKPQTYMNLSGKAVKKILNYYQAQISDLIIISDDIDLPVGIARIRLTGKSGGHKGIQNIIDTLGKKDFTRIKIGINSIKKPVNPRNQINTVNFVLGKFNKREEKIIEKIIEKILNYLMPYIGSKKTLPAHTIRIK